MEKKRGWDGREVVMKSGRERSDKIREMSNVTWICL